MKRFLDEDFLLETDTAAQLYHEHAEKMPIFDFHTHIDPKEILENRSYPDLCAAWLARIFTNGASCAAMASRSAM